MSKVLLSALLTAALAIIPATAAAMSKGDSCTLSEDVKVSARNKGKGKKKQVSGGTEITIVNAKKGWLQIKASRTKGWIKSTSLARVCAAEADLPSEPIPVEPAADIPAADDAGAGGSMNATDAPDWAADDGGGGGTEGSAISLEDGDSSGGGEIYDDESSGHDDAAPADISKEPFIAAGGGFVFGSKIKRPGLRGEGYVDLGFLLPHLRAGGNFVFWFPEFGTALTFNGDAHYLFDLSDTVDGLRVYPLAGLAIAHARVSVPATPFTSSTTVSATEIGLNIGAGGEYDLGFARVYAETKFMLIEGSQLVIGGGIRFGF